MENIGREQKLIEKVEKQLDLLRTDYGLSTDSVVEIIQTRQEDSAGIIPVSVFNSSLGALEAIVKYLKEEKRLSYSAIARLLRRNPGPIGVTYRNAKRKCPGRLDIGSNERLPLSIFGNELSVLESIVSYMLSQGYTMHDIAVMLERDDRTIWTVSDRARRKSR